MAGITIDDIFQNNKSNAGGKKVQQKAKLQHIHYSELNPSEDEFYSLEQEDIEKLAYSILMCDGIKQPVTCRKTAPNEYEIISGHKRHAAVKFLVQDGYPEYEKIPCIVENYDNDNARHAELILTNFTQRERTAFEKMKEVERLEQILKDMEESGELEKIWKEKNKDGEYRKLAAVELRQLIADVLGISKTQVANFKNISSNLSSSAMDKFKSGELPVSAAAQLAGMEKEKQEELVQKDNLDIKEIKKEKKISGREKELIKKYIIKSNIEDRQEEKRFIRTLRNKENCTNKAPVIRGEFIMERRKDKKGRVLQKGESQRKNGSYVYQYKDNYGTRKSVYANNLSDLRKKEKQIVRDLEDNINTLGAEITLNAQFDKYITLKTQLSNSTRQNYIDLWNGNLRNNVLGNKRLCDIKKSDILRFYNSLSERGLKYSTIKAFHCMISPSFELAVDDDIIRKNPCKGCLGEFSNDMKEYH